MPVMTKAENVHIRASDTEKATLAEAARLNNQKLSQFILTTALASAQEILARRQTILLSREAFDAFSRRLDEAPQEIPALKAQARKAVTFRD